MKTILFALLMAALSVVSTTAQSEDKAAADPSSANAGAGDLNNPDMLKQAFDGAMTCAAVTAIIATETPNGERWRWDNRSFAFGMLAARFWQNATQEQMTMKLLDQALNQYAGRIADMEAPQREGYETSCSAKYADVDKLCEINECLHKGPPEVVSEQ